MVKGADPYDVHAEGQHVLQRQVLDAHFAHRVRIGRAEGLGLADRLHFQRGAPVHLAAGHDQQPGFGRADMGSLKHPLGGHDVADQGRGGIRPGSGYRGLSGQVEDPIGQDRREHLLEGSGLAQIELMHRYGRSRPPCRCLQAGAMHLPTGRETKVCEVATGESRCSGNQCTRHLHPIRPHPPVRPAMTTAMLPDRDGRDSGVWPRCRLGTWL